MNILVGQGPQEDPFFYDHPYFGQLLLSATLQVVGYPDIVNPSIGDVGTIESLHLIPRILMGIFAVVDTFLVYKIAQRRYDTKTGLIASTLFAVVPVTLFLRRVWLEPIMLPLILLSIFFALPSSPAKTNKMSNRSFFLSGIFLGLAIYTKIPSFTIIPMVAYLVYQNSRKDNRALTVGLWFIPVILMPLIWPAYATITGHFEHWLAGLFWQLDREGRTLLYAILYNYNLDPLMIILGIAGLVFAAIKRDTFLLLWTIPFIIFLYFIGFVSYWHLVPLFPAACIAIARMAIDISEKIALKRIQNLAILATFSIIVCLGLLGSIGQINSNANSPYFEAAAFVTKYLQDHESSDSHKSGITIIADPFYEWIPRYVFGLKGISYKDYFSYRKTVTDDHVLLVIDNGFKGAMSQNNEVAKNLAKIYNNTVSVAQFGGRDNLHSVIIRR
jgi:hypothetical protein